MGVGIGDNFGFQNQRYRIYDNNYTYLTIPRNGSSNVIINNELDVNGSLNAGNVGLTGSLGVTGNVNINGTLGVTGNANINGTIATTNTATSSSTTTGALVVTGGVGIGQNLNVGGTLGVTGNANINGTLGVTGNANINGNLGVTGALVVTGGVGIGGNVNISGDVNIGGGALIMDNISIGNTSGAPNLSLNSSGFFVNSISSGSTADNVLCYSYGTGEIFYNTSKTFVINHPIDDSKYLVHGCLEGPEVGIYYRGESCINNGRNVIVELPNYVKYIGWNFMVSITKIYSGEESYGKTYETSRVVDGKFTVYGPNGSFFWLVHGERSKLVVEPDKNKNILMGDGPYTYIVPKL